MKKTLVVAIVILSATLFAACGNTKYIVDISGMPEAQKENHEKLLQEFIVKYETAGTDTEKMENAFEVGFQYGALGRNDEAISYYEEVLKYDPAYYPALNNLANIYKDTGEISKALGYEKKLYEFNPDAAEVISDMVELLVLDKQYDEARKILKEYALTGKGSKDGLFILEKMDYITEKEKN